MTIDTIHSMLSELSLHKRSKEKLLKHYIEERLEKGVQSYYDDLRKSSEVLKYKDAEKVLRKLNKEEKRG